MSNDDSLVAERPDFTPDDGGEGTPENPRRVYVGIPDDPSDVVLRINALRILTDVRTSFVVDKQIHDSDDPLGQLLTMGDEIVDWFKTGEHAGNSGPVGA